MIVVVDTNVLVQLFGRLSQYRSLRDALRNGNLVLAVSTPILLEYEEVICRYADQARWKDVLCTVQSNWCLLTSASVQVLAIDALAAELLSTRRCLATL